MMGLFTILRLLIMVAIAIVIARWLGKLWDKDTEKHADE